MNGLESFLQEILADQGYVVVRSFSKVTSEDRFCVYNDKTFESTSAFKPFVVVGPATHEEFAEQRRKYGPVECRKYGLDVQGPYFYKLAMPVRLTP